MYWYKLNNIDFSELSKTRKIYHLAIQNVAAVGRRFLPKKKDDSNANLEWIPSHKRLASRWIEGKIKFRSSIGFDDFTIHLVNSEIESISKFELNGKKHNQVLVWLEKQIVNIGLDASSLALNLPYQLPVYPEAKGKPFNIEDFAFSKELGKYFHNSQIIIKEINSKIKNASDIRVWPHHFDISSLITINDTGNHETSSSINLGMSPGDDSIDEPYFYIVPWPYPEVMDLKELDTPAFWVTEDWFGGVLKSSDLVKKASDSKHQYEIISKFYNNGLRILEKIVN